MGEGECWKALLAALHPGPDRMIKPRSRRPALCLEGAKWGVKIHGGE